MTDPLRERIAAAALNAYAGTGTAWAMSEGDVRRRDWLEIADAVIRELPELSYAHFPQRIALSHASQSAESRRLDAADWLEKELTSAGLECGAGWVLYSLVDGVVARLNGAVDE